MSQLASWFLLFNRVSLLASSISTGILLLLECVQSPFLNRVTLRYQLIIILLDVIRHTMYNHNRFPYTGNCIAKFIDIFIDHIHVFCNIFIALHLHIRFMLNRQPSKLWERHIFRGLVVFSVLICSFPLGLEIYGSINRIKSFYQHNMPYHFVMNVFLIYLPLIPGIFYSVGMFIPMVFTIYHRSDSIRIEPKYFRSLYLGEFISPFQFLKKLRLRLLTLPLSLIICIVPFIALTIFSETGFKKSNLFWLTQIGHSLSGLMHTLSLFTDPFLPLALTQLNRICIDDSGLERKSYSKAVNIFDIRSKQPKNEDLDQECYVDLPNGHKIKFEEYLRYL